MSAGILAKGPRSPWASTCLIRIWPLAVASTIALAACGGDSAPVVPDVGQGVGGGVGQGGAGGTAPAPLSEAHIMTWNLETFPLTADTQDLVVQQLDRAREVLGDLEPVATGRTERELEEPPRDGVAIDDQDRRTYFAVSVGGGCHGRWGSEDGAPPSPRPSASNA